MPATTIRDEARRQIDQLPEDATREDLLYDPAGLSTRGRIG